MTTPVSSAVWVETVPWGDARAEALREAMDAELSPRYADRIEEIEPEQAEILAAALALDPATVALTIIATVAGEPVGHAVLRDLGPAFADALEVKRVYVAPQARGTGVSRALMFELESFARSQGKRRLILQTGDRQPDAVALYEKIGYTRIPTYPPYEPITFSNCFEKVLD